MDQKTLTEFRSPPSAYRGKPFWAWNGLLEENELRRQIRIMQQMGLGGFFMHSRVGLATPYLGEEWFKCVAACVDEARKLGMEAWLYDEDRWPSGAAGGLVTKNPRYRMRYLKMERVEDPASFKWTDDVIALFAAKIDGLSASGVRRLAKTSWKKAIGQMAGGESLLAFRVRMKDPSPWYNGYTYLDTLNKRAVAQFIKVTHEAYRRRFQREFGRTIPGIFTDEPNYGENQKDIRSWTDDLPAVFRRRYGYDLLDHLPELFFDVDGRTISKVRLNFFDCITHLFVESFSKQIGQWCGRYGLLYTGHMLCEDDLRDQTRVVGACMRHYEHMQAAGMDLLTEHWRIYTTAKQVSSAARQFGWKWRLTEIYGCTGWDFPFEAHKALGDWQVATGINLRCQHLSWYTMLGEAKRDYPAAIFYQSPWWQYYSKVEDYFARIHVIMTRGEEVRDLLVIHPIESMWAMFRGEPRKEASLAEFDQTFNDVSNALLSAQMDYDFGDEELLSRHAAVVRQKDAPPVLKVGRARYKAVLVPPMKTIRSTTLNLLRQFAEAGGVVVFAGEVATHVEGEPSNEPAVLAGLCRRADIGRGMIDALSPVCRRISVTDPAGNALAPVIYLLREDRDSYCLFVANTSHLPRQWNGDPLVRDRREAFPEVLIRGFADCAGAPIELDPSTGGMFAASATRTQDGWEIRTSLPRIGSRLYVIPKRAGDISLAPARQVRDVSVVPAGSGPWKISLNEPNVLVLDRARYRIGNGQWQGPEEILRIDRAVRQSMGVPPRGGQMCQPWAAKIPARPRRTTVSLSYSFNADCVPSGELALALEQPHRFKVSVNGTPVSTDVEYGWWTDTSCRRLPVDPAVLRRGPNEITLECDYDETFSGLEIMYLLGDFGTVVNGTNLTLTAPPRELHTGDWTTQGLAFYGGSVAYRRTLSAALEAGQRLFVRLGEYRGVAVRVLIDGRQAGIIAWEPAELDITDFVTGGEFDLTLEVLGHRRNSHGPLHLSEKWPTWTGPYEFIVTGDRWFEGYQLVPCGLMSEPQLVIKA